MTHLDLEQLAHLALHPGGPVDADRQTHLDGCAECRAEVAELTDVLQLVQTAPHGALPPAPPQVWERILDELGPEIGRSPVPSHRPRPTEPVEFPEPGPNRYVEARALDTRRERRRWLAPVAAAIGLIVGVLGTWIVVRDGSGDPTPTATTQLAALAGKSGSGSAQLFDESGGAELRIGASGLGRPQGFYEVWLINADGKRMVSLGVLDAAGTGTFGVPANAVAQGYRTVDVSLEPDDGNPEHSRNSIIRGQLPS